MKKFFKTSVVFSMMAFILAGCSNSSEKKEAENTSKEQAPAPADTKGNTDPAKKGITLAEANDFLEANEANSGKEVTVSAFSWGSNERMDGKVQLNLGDKKLEGMEAAAFSCMFPKEQTETLKAIGKNTIVTVTGKISKGAGGTELNDCRILQ